MTKALIKTALIGLVSGIIGVTLVLAVVHLWADHAALHAIINIINQNPQLLQKPTP